MPLDVMTRVRSRARSKSFLVPFAAVTALFVINLVGISLLGSTSPILEYPLFSYGAIFSIYLVCVIECLGISCFVGLLSRLRMKLTF